MNIKNSFGRVEFEKDCIRVNGIVFHCRSRLNLTFFEGHSRGHLDAISEYRVGRQLFLELASVLAASQISLNLEVGSSTPSLHTFVRGDRWVAAFLDEEIDCGVKCEISNYCRTRGALPEDDDGLIGLSMEIST